MAGIHQDILGYRGLGILGLSAGCQNGWIHQDILGYLGLGILGAARMAGIHQDILGYLGLGLGAGYQNGRIS